MGIFKFLFKWSLEITGTLMVSYYGLLKPEQQAQLYGFYRSLGNSYRASKHIYGALNDYKALVPVDSNNPEYANKLSEVNTSTAKRIQQLARTNKGVYMRLGQYLGHLKYAFPREFHNVLKELNLNPNYQPEDYKYIKTHLEHQLGKKTRQFFESLNISPIKSDNFYQVYKGQLAENLLDITIKVLHPYAEYEAKYDFWFLNKALGYVNEFKQKNFAATPNLYLDQIFGNLKNSVNQELDLLAQQKQSLELKQKFASIIADQKSKVGVRPIPLYFPHIYSQYTKKQILIQEYFDGYHMSNAEALFKENYSKRHIASDIIGIWNTLFEKQQILLQNYAPFDIFIRKSRPTEEGPYQICLLNTGLISPVSAFFVQPYFSLYKDLISDKKINPKKPQERIDSVRSFHQNLSQTYFTFFLKQNEKLQEFAQKTNLEVFNPSSKLLDLAVDELPKQIKSKLQQKKFVTVSKKGKNPPEQTQNQYENLKRYFELEYQPWRLQTLFQTYKEIFREEKHFGAF